MRREKKQMWNGTRGGKVILVMIKLTLKIYIRVIS